MFDSSVSRHSCTIRAVLMKYSDDDDDDSDQLTHFDKFLSQSAQRTQKHISVVIVKQLRRFVHLNRAEKILHCKT